ncbi:hypothetical protein OSTOST_05845, partial [Ostertagia ostertagi]
NHTRFVILLLCTLCLSIAQSNTLTLNFTVICMAGDPIDIDRYGTSGTTLQTLSNDTYYEEIGNFFAKSSYERCFHAIANNCNFSTVFTVTRPSDRLALTSRHRFFFKNHTRFVILLLCTLCLSIAQSNTLTLNFTVICMAGDPIDIDRYGTSGTTLQTLPNDTYYEVGNSSDLLEHDQAVYARHNYAYSPNEKNILFSVVAIGAMVAVYPVMWLIQVELLSKIVQDGVGMDCSDGRRVARRNPFVEQRADDTIETSPAERKLMLTLSC